MPIYSTDIRTRKAAISGQFDTSGGEIHPTEYVRHHEVGSLLPKLTEVDHAGGRFDAAKCFLSLESEGSEQGDDCYTYLDQTPADPLVSVLLCRPAAMGDRAGYTDTRAELTSYVEAYQIQAGPAPWYLRELHVAGMRTLVLWCRESVRLPEVGQTLYIVANEGTGGEYSQYVQIADYTTELQTFTVPRGDQTVEITRRILYVDITTGLGHAFIGPGVTESDPVDPDVLIRETVVANASRYYGRAQLVSAAEEGDSAVQVDSVYGQVVPSARAEVPLSALPALTTATQTMVSGPETFTLVGPTHTQRERCTAATRRTTWTRVLLPIPGTGNKVQAHVRILDRWYIVREGESSTVGTLTVNRNNGSTLLILTALPDADTWLIWEWASGVHFQSRAGHAVIDPIVIPFTLPGQAEAGTLELTWTSGGVTKTATESAYGQITGHGAGYRVGSNVVLWLTANIPDGGTTIGYSYEPLSTVVETITPTVVGSTGSFTTADPPRAGSLVVSWTVRRASAAIAKSQEGTAVTTRTSAVVLGACGLGQAGECTYTPGATTTEVKISGEETSTSVNDLLTRIRQDNGDGVIAETGTVNYTTGAVSMPLTTSFSRSAYTITTNSGVESGSWSTSNQAEVLDGTLTVRYALAETVPGATVTGSIPVPPLTIPLLRGAQDQVVPGTLRFLLGSKVYSDRDGIGGVLYWDDGSTVGTVDYAARVARVTQWSGITPSVSLRSLITTYGQFSLQQVTFRCSAQALAPGSFQLVATAEDGSEVSITGGLDGTLSGTGLSSGTVEHSTGVVALTFSEPVFPNSIVYSATAYRLVPLSPEIIGIDPVRLPPDGRVAKLRSGDYAVVYEDGTSTLPNPAIAGATVALPQPGLAFAMLEDGAGEQTYTMPSGLSAGNTYQVPTSSRTGPLEYLVLEDAEGRPVAGQLYTPDLALWRVTLPATFSASGYTEPFIARYLALVSPADYTVDREAGTLTLADPLVLTGYTQPLLCRWRIHDLGLITEARTDGVVSLQTTLTHAYSTDAAISSMLVHGDLGARWVNGFSQHTDTGVWLDYLSGSAPTGGGRYDFTGYPPVVTNRGAIRQRWRIKRRSDGQWDVIGETLGVIMVWNGTSTLEAKRSMLQATPYFTLYHTGLGTSGGWSTGNFFQFETLTANAPLWMVRTVKPGAPTVTTDGIRIRHRVGAD